MTTMEEISFGKIEANFPITIIKNSHLKLSLSPQTTTTSTRSSQLPQIAIWKDERLDYLDIPKDLVEILQINGFTIEMILDYGSSHIAEKLGIDDYVAQIIFNEATKRINKV
jgi:hypothetical protein